MAWDYKKWGTLGDPIHKSDLQQLTSAMFGCTRAFKFRKDAQANGDDPAPTISGKSALGTATHETISRALTNGDVVDRLLGGGSIRIERVEEVFRAELERAADGRELVWYGKSDNPDKLAQQKVAMVTGLLNDLHRHVAEVVLVEPGFIAKLGDYWIAGQVDLVYRPRSNPRGLAFCDWKSGASLPHPIELEHGFESGFYAHALHDGSFLPRERIALAQTEAGDWAARYEAGGGATTVRPHRMAAERACMERALIELACAAEPPAGVLKRFDAFPDELHYVHLQDYVPYEKAGSKSVDRAEQLAFYGLQSAGKVKYVAGDRRGPGWYRMARRESDVPRLQHLLRQVVGLVRMGRFFESIGDKCARCPYKQPCLTSGYAPTGDTQRELLQAVKEVDFDGLGGEAA